MPGTWEDRDSPDRSPAASQHVFASRDKLQDLKEEDDCPASRESQKGSERGYPDGPIRVYDSGLYLYMEPSREEASKFDVVFNVAKEVANPFKRSVEKNDTVMAVWKSTFPPPNQTPTAEPATAMSERSFKSAFEFLPAESESPTTPKPETSEPEYIHVPWDHNSEILEDLYPLCEMIDGRISKGKRVLVHCQLGVSRSASLVIAYGLYKNPDLDFNAMYGIVKGRSCWVGPNMSLIYQLTDFRSRVRNGGPSRAPLAEWFTEDRERKNVPSEPKTAEPPKPHSLSPLSPLPQSIDAHLARSDNLQFGPPVSQFGTVNGHPLMLSTAASSPPFNRMASSGVLRQGLLWRPLPLREKYQTIHALRRPPRYDTNQASHRMLYRPPLQTDLNMRDAANTPPLLSPRAAEFCAVPFSRTMAGDLAFHDSMDSPSSLLVRSSGLNDPRSPPQRRDPLIMRNIDEFL